MNKRKLPSEIPDTRKVQLPDKDYELLEELFGIDIAKEMAEPIPDFSEQYEFTAEEMAMIMSQKKQS